VVAGRAERPGAGSIIDRIDMRKFLTRLRLRHLLLGLLLLNGILPLLASNLFVLRSNRELLKDQEKTNLTRAAEVLSQRLNGELAAARSQLGLLGSSLLAGEGAADLEERLAQPGLLRSLQRFQRANPNVLALRVLSPSGQGPALVVPNLPSAASAALDGAFEASRRSRRAEHSFALLAPAAQAATALAVPVLADGREPVLWVESLLTLPLLSSIFQREAQSGVDVFLLANDGSILWSEGASAAEIEAVRSSDEVRGFARFPLNATAEYEIQGPEGALHMVGMLSAIPEAGWSVLVHRPAAAAFRAARQTIWNTAASSGLLLLGSLALAAYLARRVSEPIQTLARTANEIAQGQFGERVAVPLAAGELRDLAKSFNRMSGHVQMYVDRLSASASTNQELFIGSIRAFAAAIDAKDPYTRGHSERVAESARVLARKLGWAVELQERVWIAALLHDVGKIGVDDSVLNKGGGLSEDEFVEMRAHPVVGEEILRPIVQLREILPAIRWHHESWDGSGYPDGLKGEQIPLIARIVAIADTFDAMTTNRPYQAARTWEWAVQQIAALAGKKFDPQLVATFARACEAGEVRTQRHPPTQGIVAVAERS
jgi:HD-GYP domain-containing protein (c-di-GMP phosphodiesterase class II)